MILGETDVIYGGTGVNQGRNKPDSGENRHACAQSRPPLPEGGMDSPPVAILPPPLWPYNSRLSFRYWMKASVDCGTSTAMHWLSGKSSGL